MFTKSRRLIVGLTAVFAISAGLMAPASAAPATMHATASTQAAATALPLVKITQLAGQKAKYHPKTITVASKDFSAGCTKKRAVLRVANKTAASQTMLFNGSPFATIGAGASEIICASGPSGASGVFNLQGSKSTLTITLS